VIRKGMGVPEADSACAGADVGADQSAPAVDKLR
jgi:hypothetical protein